MPQSESAIYIKKQLNTIFKNPTIKQYMFYLLVFYNTQQLIKLYLYFLFLVPSITEYINKSSICTQREREREMSSSEEERLVQMIEDFIESESPSPIFSASSTCLPLNYHTQYLTLQEIVRSGTQAEAEILECVLRHMRNKRDAKKTTSLKKWLVMKHKIDGYNASLCQTSWLTSLGCPAGDYDYIDITMKNENGDPMRLIVDIDFRSQFELARPTPTYKELTNILPHVFVGTEDKLNKIISILCSAAKQSLRERGLHIPPWRTITYMQSKWLSACHRLPTAVGSSENSNRETKGDAQNYSKWAPSPPMVNKSKRSNLAGGSGLSSQFSNMSINCC